MRGVRGLGRFNPSLGVSCGAAELQSLYFFFESRRGRGAGAGEWARGRKKDEWIKEKKNNPSLRMGLEPGRVPGHRWERSEQLPRSWAAWRPPGRPRGGQPGLWPRRAGVGPQCRGAGVTDGGRVRGGGGAAAGARPGGGPAGAGLPSRAPLLLELREGGAKQL